jgi:hypothetical protein
LSSAQKRDLAGQAVAAVITTALIAAPLVSPSVRGAAGWADAALPAQSYAGPVIAVAVADTQGWPALRIVSRPPASSNVRPAGRLSAHALPAVALPAVAVPAVAVPEAVGTSGEGPITPEPAARGIRKPLSQRLSGWLVGDGSHSIRPFPSIASVR